jgi:hypothetical protein
LTSAKIALCEARPKLAVYCQIPFEGQISSPSETWFAVMNELSQVHVQQGRIAMIKSIHTVIAAASIVIASASADATIVPPPPPVVAGAPDCSGAAASLGVIWPPNHTMISETIVGVTDPSGLTPSIVVTGIMQDEPVSTLGSGNTSPDGAGVGSGTAWVRAERAGPGTGRIYFIAFTATNSQGLQCSSTVPVFVPHDQGQGFTPIDTGMQFDSTQTYF